MPQVRSVKSVIVILIAEDSFVLSPFIPISAHGFYFYWNLNALFQIIKNILRGEGDNSIL